MTLSKKQAQAKRLRLQLIGYVATGGRVKQQQPDERANVRPAFEIKPERRK